MQAYKGRSIVPLNDAALLQFDLSMISWIAPMGRMAR